MVGIGDELGGVPLPLQAICVAVPAVAAAVAPSSRSGAKTRIAMSAAKVPFSRPTKACKI